MAKAEERYFDFLIIGSGIAGASLALKLSHLGQVGLVCKESLFESNTRYAQGGIASVQLARDSYEKHAKDTMKAGGFLGREEVVRRVVEVAPQCIAELVDLGVPFTPYEEQDKEFDFHLTKEGGHSKRRILHAKDLTGEAIQRTLESRIRENPQITVLEYHMGIDLLVTDKVCPDFSRNRCLGAYVLNNTNQDIFAIKAKATFLATGGHGKLYLYTSNPAGATGDGLAMAWRAGARVANLEFMQFHPTCLYHNKAKNFLISEALRGEGAYLYNKQGKRFMEYVDPKKELAPRDIVARAIDSEMKTSGANHVLLDISHKGERFIKNHFPNIYHKCLSLGIDITQESIPVVPAAHYSCGGVVTDTRGRTGVKSLWGLGEVACTGLHGANRLASNSLLEGVAFAEFIYQDVKSILPAIQKLDFPAIPEWETGKAAVPDEMVVIHQLWDEIRRTMWNYVGIVRTDKRLDRAESRIRQIGQEIKQWYWDVVPNRSLLEVRNLATVAELTIRCARSRKESRGIHYSIDHPVPDDKRYKKDTVILH